MTTPSAASQQAASALKKANINIALPDLEELLKGSLAAPQAEQQDEWLALVAPAADAETKRH